MIRCTCRSIRPGSIVRPRVSTMVAPSGTFTSLAGPTATIFSPSITTAAWWSGGPPCPSSSIPPTRASARGCAGACAGRSATKTRATGSRRVGIRWAGKTPELTSAPPGSRRQAGERVDRAVRDADLEVQVRPRRLARPAHVGDQLALLDARTRHHEVVLVVGVHGRVAALVREHDDAPVAALATAE